MQKLGCHFSLGPRIVEIQHLNIHTNVILRELEKESIQQLIYRDGMCE